MDEKRAELWLGGVSLMLNKVTVLLVLGFVRHENIIFCLENTDLKQRRYSCAFYRNLIKNF